MKTAAIPLFFVNVTNSFRFLELDGALFVLPRAVPETEEPRLVGPAGEGHKTVHRDQSGLGTWPGTNIKAFLKQEKYVFSKS